MPPTITQPHARTALYALAVSLAVLAQPAPLRAQTMAPGPARSEDPFERRGWHLELSAALALEAWNYNGSREEMYGIAPGITYGLPKGLVLTAGGPLYYISQRGTDAFLLGGTFGVRGRIVRRGRTSAFWEFQVGVSHADTHTPPRGTRFNYLALGGGGVTIRVRPHTHLLAAVKWVHVSNNGLAGRERNPDIEAVGPRLGILIGF